MKTFALVLMIAGVALADPGGRDEALRRLESTRVSPDFRSAAFPEVLEYFRAVTGVSFVQVSGPEPRVSLTLKDVSARTALRLVLRPYGLEARLRDGAVVISPREEAPILTRLYDIRSLVQELRDHPGPRVELRGSSEGPLVGG